MGKTMFHDFFRGCGMQRTSLTGAIGWRRWILGAALGIAVTSAAFPAPEDDYQAGRKAFQGGDMANAMALLRKAADIGHAGAQTLLGYILDISDENEEALKYYRLAANQGHAEAQYGLGTLYSVGEGVKKDPAEALKWFHRAAEQNHVPAILALAQAYWRTTLGLDAAAKPPPEEALRWIKRAAENNDVASIQAMAVAYRRGLLGLAPDPEQALAWEERAKKLVTSPTKNLRQEPKK